MTTAPTDTPRRRVLVVEDDQAIRELLRLHLTLSSFDVTPRDPQMMNGMAASPRGWDVPSAQSLLLEVVR